MPQFTPFLAINGNCTEAFDFYARTIGAPPPTYLRYGQLPGGCPPHLAADAHKVMHAKLHFQGSELHGCDTIAGGGGPYQPPRSIDIVLQFDTAERAQQVFQAFAEGGEIKMPIQKADWAEAFGMLRDRFGIEWMINGAQVQP